MPESTASPYAAGRASTQRPSAGQGGYGAPRPAGRPAPSAYSSGPAGRGPDGQTYSPYGGAPSPVHDPGRGPAGRPPRSAPYRDDASYGQGGLPADQGRRAAQRAAAVHPDDIDHAPQRGRHATDWDSGFDRVVGWTLLGGLLPGTGLVASGRRGLGWLIVASWGLVAAGAVWLVAFGNPLQFFTMQVLAHPERLTPIAMGCVAVAVLWAGHLVVTNVSLRRFAALTGVQSALSWLLVATLAAGGIGAGVGASKWVQLGGETLNAALGGDDDSLSSGAKKPDAAKADPWVNTPRINVLLIGSDAGADRKGVRTDTIIVASIDTKTGNTVMFSLPRNLEHVPFPPGTQQAADYPEGYFCPDHACMLNALWQFGEEHKKQYYAGEKNPGLAATIQGVETTLGLRIDNYAMLNLRGFMQFVDAIGGATINVARPIPVGGHKDARTGREVGVTSYIKPGKRKLNGYQTLWYARSRSDSDDFERMSRQRCVIAALTQQADPATLAVSLPGIMRAARDNITTSIRVADVGAWVTLALRVQKAKVTSLAFTNKVIASGDPDFEKIQELVQTEINRKPKPAASPAPTTSASPSATPSSGTKRPKPSATQQQDPEEAADVKAVC